MPSFLYVSSGHSIANLLRIKLYLITYVSTGYNNRVIAIDFEAPFPLIARPEIYSPIIISDK